MKGFNKKVTAWILALGLTASMVPFAAGTVFAQTAYTQPTQPTTADVQDSVGGQKTTVHNFYANGNSVVISETAAGKTVAQIAGDETTTWDLSEGHWFVYAGTSNADAAVNYENASITMNGGTVDNIIGSNKTAGSIENVKIEINDGTVGCVISNRGNSGGGAPTYDARTDYKVINSTVTFNGGTIGAYMGTYGYTYTDNIVLNVKNGTFTAQTSPVQTGIILGGTNGEVRNATMNMTGGKTAGLSLAQRTMITGKATLNLQGGTVGNIYAGSFYNSDEKSGSSWWTSNIGYINYGQAAALDITIAKGVDYHDIFAGFQFYASEVSLLKSTFASTQATHVAFTTDYSKAPVQIVLEEKPSTAYDPSQDTANKDNLSLLKAVGMQNITITDKTIVPDLPSINPSAPADEVQVAVTDKTSAETLKNDVNDLVTQVQQGGSETQLNGVVSSDSTKTVAEQMAAAIAAGESITVQATVAPLESTTVSSEEKALAAQLDANATIAQYLDLKLELKAGDTVIGTMTQLSTPITYTIAVPQDLIREGVELFVIRLHNGVADALPLTHVEGNLYSFTTDRFSTYALASKATSSTSSTATSSVAGTTGSGSDTTSSSVESGATVSSNASSPANTPATGGNGPAILVFFAMAFCTAAVAMIFARRKYSDQ